jgi:hypothetical protein
VGELSTLAAVATACRGGRPVKERPPCVRKSGPREKTERKQTSRKRAGDRDPAGCRRPRPLEGVLRRGLGCQIDQDHRSSSRSIWVTERLLNRHVAWWRRRDSNPRLPACKARPLQSSDLHSFGARRSAAGTQGLGGSGKTGWKAETVHIRHDPGPCEWATRARVLAWIRDASHQASS